MKCMDGLFALCILVDPVLEYCVCDLVHVELYPVYGDICLGGDLCYRSVFSTFIHGDLICVLRILFTL